MPYKISQKKNITKENASCIFSGETKSATLPLLPKQGNAALSSGSQCVYRAASKLSVFSMFTVISESPK
jgi:hypothetical protein